MTSPARDQQFSSRTVTYQSPGYPLAAVVQAFLQRALFDSALPLPGAITGVTWEVQP